MRWFLFFLPLFFIGCSSNSNPSSKINTLLPHQELREIANLSSDLRISKEQLQKWDEIVRTLLRHIPLQRKADPYRLYAYLYCAQKYFADNSFAITNSYSGSLDYVSFRIVNLFYPDYKNNDVKTDSFSAKLTDLIMRRIEKRYRAEEKNIHPIQIPKKEGYWRGENPVGLHYQTIQPWILKQTDEFKTPAPPPQEDPFWKNQLKETQNYAKSASDAQKHRSLFWERLVDPEASDWRFIAVSYMNEQSTPLEMQLAVRSKMMMALIDALIAVFHDKYAYLVRRPFMLDSNTKTLFTTPNHPSYPAAHATLSGAAETILSYYFPENQKQWNHLANESRESRLWGGIHFPIDLEVGKKQGCNVGKAVLFR